MRQQCFDKNRVVASAASDVEHSPCIRRQAAQKRPVTIISINPVGVDIRCQIAASGVPKTLKF